MATPIGEAVATMELDTRGFIDGLRNVEMRFEEASGKLDQQAQEAGESISQSIAGGMQDAEEGAITMADAFEGSGDAASAAAAQIASLSDVSDTLNGHVAESSSELEQMKEDLDALGVSAENATGAIEKLGQADAGGGGISGGKLRTFSRAAFAGAGLASVMLEGRGGAVGESVSTVGQFAQAGGGIGMMAGPQGAAIGIATGAVVGLVKAISDLGDESAKAMEALEKSSAGAAIRSATRRMDEAIKKAQAAGVDEGFLKIFKEDKARQMEFLGKARGFAEKDPTDILYGVDQIRRRGVDFEARLSAQTLAASEEFMKSVSPEKIMDILNARKESETNRKLEELSADQLRVLIEIKSKPDPIATVG